MELPLTFFSSSLSRISLPGWIQTSCLLLPPGFWICDNILVTGSSACWCPLFCVQFGRGLWRKSPEWNLWRVQWFTGMANHVASFCTHLSATFQSLAINPQVSITGMVQGSRGGFWKLKKKLKWGTNPKILQPCASARAVVGYWGKWRGWLPSNLPCSAWFTPSLSPDRHKKGTHTDQRGAAGCALCNASGPSIQWWAQRGRAVWSQPLLSTTKQLHHDTEVPVQWKEITQGPRKPLLRVVEMLSRVHCPGGTGVGLWDRGYRSSASYSEVLLMQRPWIIQQWCSHYGGVLTEGKQVICLICISVIICGDIIYTP